LVGGHLVRGDGAAADGRPQVAGGLGGADDGGAPAPGPDDRHEPRGDQDGDGRQEPAPGGESFPHGVRSRCGAASGSRAGVRGTRRAAPRAATTRAPNTAAMPGFPASPRPAPPRAAPAKTPRLWPAAFRDSAVPRRGPHRRTSRLTAHAATTAWLAACSAVTARASGSRSVK